MDDTAELALKSLCCTCLSNDRKLSQLCRITDGVNNLYSLLACDSEAYREGFYKEAASLFICWECAGIMRRMATFRRQACVAQKQLSNIVDGRDDIPTNKSLSSLIKCHKANFDITITYNQETDNFVDCGPEINAEDLDNIPLSELHDNISDVDFEIETTEIENNHVNKKVKNPKRKNVCKTDKYKDYYVTTQIGEEEIAECRERRKMRIASAGFKCESCVEVFKNETGLERHNEEHHVAKTDHTQCPVCLRYVKTDTLPAHKSEHCSYHTCLLCDDVCYSIAEMVKHLKTHKHARRKKTQKLKESNQMRDTAQDESSGFPCAECNKCFENKNQRWKHVQRHHREGYKCPTCGKRFAFKNNLTRHEQVHSTPPPREQCPTCHKLVRVDLLKTHSRIHSHREKFACVECAKTFVSRASYEHHLKYTQAHASKDILKYKCSVCDKGYRSRGELRDHVNYQHIGQTQHKCPVCGKALATRRCITRHVRRAHQGVKEGPRDKICQQCGKAFRDKKGLREHEYTHTGERPLACEVCGRTFRQSASLYTHRRRVHRAPPARKPLDPAHGV